MVDVSSGGPAQSAGLQQGDIITELEGRDIVTSSQLQNAVARRTPGATIAMTVFRDGDIQRIDVRLGERPPLRSLQLAQRGWQEFDEFGVTVRELTPEMASDLGVETETGVVVGEVVDGGYADDVGIKAGDVIVRFDDVRVETTRDFALAMRAFDPEGTTRIRIHRGDTSFTVLIE